MEFLGVPSIFTMLYTNEEIMKSQIFVGLPSNILQIEI